MKRTSTATSDPGHGHRSRRGSLGDIWPVVAFAASLALGAQFAVDVGVGPVPITLQTLALCVGAALLDPLRSALGVSVYLLAGAAGLPMFADGTAGWSVLAGRTGGFLLGFLLVAPAIAWLVRSWRGDAAASQRLLLRLLLLFVVAHLLVLLVGGLRLGAEIGHEAAVQHGVLPFLPGGVVKSLAAAVAVDVISRLRRRSGNGSLT